MKCFFTNQQTHASTWSKLVKYWPSIVEAEPTLIQHRVGSHLFFAGNCHSQQAKHAIYYFWSFKLLFIVECLVPGFKFYNSNIQFWSNRLILYTYDILQCRENLDTRIYDGAVSQKLYTKICTIIVISKKL